ncbi:acetyl-CoA carboxylase carboxyltransferase subunit beta [Roseospira marina]|uniref:Acetyl-coenzyme A carboxylase carboxyl transferase subunit beta n=1 Tax=Roseospira marina TaxID=140057 RepID=A0A5M6IFZ5_9PROT|nr:acetyl-CoA carboxylase, carboxyltransferase subunit beta [Roseospira marina]KAA5607231.1 acetyl-CoA carboxylase carboxyltransferase subunit beta [Roseospira marina]MBB4312617.1 acetyl-CoA carboxylase carboxyl transferase subunit beta [Roseospira marina]MBB5085367.1 acetyl-CoA carboxylase carboxyl transferase subunit beta [Roseospira marina]
MNWLSDYVRPKFRNLVGSSREVPDNLWHKCSECGHMIFHKELDKARRVCTQCGQHMRLPVKHRLAMLFDDGVYERAPTPKVAADPLKFRDVKRYTDRLKDAQARNGESDALIVASGPIEGRTVVVAAFDFDFMGGSMGMAVGESFVVAAEKAVELNAPLVAIPSSGGARMQEGILSLMQMARVTVAVDMVKDAGLPYIVILTDPTTGGVTASLAMLGDVAMAEPGAIIGFAGARVIEQTIHEKLPKGFQRSEYLLEHGMVDMVVPRDALKGTLARVIRLLTVPVGPIAHPNLPTVVANDHGEGHRETEPTGPVDDTDDPHPDVEVLASASEDDKAGRRKGDAERQSSETEAASTAADQPPPKG